MTDRHFIIIYISSCSWLLTWSCSSSCSISCYGYCWQIACSVCFSVSDTSAVTCFLPLEPLVGWCALQSQFLEKSMHLLLARLWQDSCDVCHHICDNFEVVWHCHTMTHSAPWLFSLRKLVVYQWTSNFIVVHHPASQSCLVHHSTSLC